MRDEVAKNLKHLQIMKRLLLSLVLFAGIVASVWADPTAKAIYCAGNTTLYFTYDEATYTAGTAYENLDGQTATTVYNNISATGYTGRMHQISSLSTVNTPWKNYCDAITTLKFLDDFEDWTPQSLNYYFMLMKNLETIVGGKNVNTSEVTTFSYTFAICEKLTSLEELSTWDVSSATSLEGTFQNCIGLTTLEGLEDWET